MTREQKLNKIFKKMTPEEQMEYACRKLRGGMIYQPNGDVMILMGSAALKRLTEYEDEMIAKYEANTAP